MLQVSIKAALLGAAFLFVAGCGSLESLSGKDELLAAKGHGFAVSQLQAGRFKIAVASKGASSSADLLSIYIEGDGAAWPNPYHPPRDPTPIRPVSLELAEADSSPKVAYLGRPCQYLDGSELGQCDVGYWSERRFAPEVIDAYLEAITQLKASSKVKRLRLIGFSGGGVIATLLAARRNDVELLVTVASPLAVSRWIKWHGVAPLSGSIDPAAPDQSMRLPPSIHYVGANDRIVPAEIVAGFAKNNGGRVVTIPGFGHECCWARDWPQLYQLPIQENMQ